MRFVMIGSQGRVGFIGCPFWSQHWSPTPHCSFHDDHRECFETEKNELTEDDCPMMEAGTITLSPMPNEVEAADDS